MAHQFITNAPYIQDQRTAQRAQIERLEQRVRELEKENEALKTQIRRQEKSK